MKKLLFILLLPCLAYAQTNTTPQFKRNVSADSLLGYSIPGITGNHWLPDTAWVKHHVSGGSGGGTTTNALSLTYGFTGQPLSFNGSAAITGKIDSTILRTVLNSPSLSQLQTKFNLYTLTSRQIINGYGITGGHNFVTDITLAADSSLLQTVLNFFPKGDTRYYTKTLSDGKYALQATTLTINGTAFDLSTNRSWTVSGFTPVSPYTDITSDGSGNPVSSAQILHQPVKYATAAALPANTYSNGTSGVGATITENANGALTVDGSTPSVNDRILVWQEAVQTKNGIYLVTQVGDGSHPFILTRGSYSSIAGNMIAGSQVYAQLGTAYAQNTFIQTTTGTITFGTTNLVYTSSTLNFLTGYFSGAGTRSSPLFPNYDATPTNGSIYGVQSGGVYTALAGKQTTVTLTTSGTTGASTFNPSTGALNIPVYAGTSYTNGYGINLSGSTFSADTTSSTALVSKGRLATNLAGYVKQTTTVAGFALSSNVTLANLSATDATLTFSGAYTGATARTVGINLGNANTWSAKQTFSVAPNLTGSSTTNYVWTATDNAGNGSWQASSGGGGVSIIGTAGGSITNGASISGSTLTLGFGDGTNPGIVSTGTQTFGGFKTWNPTITASSGLATGESLTGTYTAAANGDLLIARDDNPTFTNGAFTGVVNIGQRIRKGTFGVGFISAPGAPTLTPSSSGGTLPANTYYYKIVGVDVLGNFTSAGVEASTTTTGSTSSVVISWTAVPNTVYYRVYRGTSSNGENVYVNLNSTFIYATTTFTDINNISISGTPPAVNSTTVGSIDANGLINGFTFGYGGNQGTTNTAIGFQTLAANTTGTFITAIGYQAGNANTTAFRGTFIGYQAGLLSTGANNTIIGSQAGITLSSGAGTTFIGTQAGNATTTASNNTSIGYQALSSNVTGTDNTAIGSSAGAGTKGNFNTMIGSSAGNTMTTGAVANVLIGYSAGSFSNSFSGTDNTIIGKFGGASITNGSHNIGIGTQNLGSLTTGTDNIAIGETALYSTTTTSKNIAVGTSAGQYISGGTSNTGPSNSIYIGYQAEALAVSQTNQIVIGYQAIGFGSNTSTIGNTSTTNANLYGAVLSRPTLTAVNSTATLTATQMGAGYITSTSGAATTLTTPTATALATQLGATRGTSYQFTIDNTLGANTVTLALDASFTLLNDITGSTTLTVPSGTTGVATWIVTFVSTTAATISRIQ